MRDCIQLKCLRVCVCVTALFIFYLFIYYLIKIQCMTIYRTIHTFNPFLSFCHSLLFFLSCIFFLLFSFKCVFNNSNKNKNRRNDAIHFFSFIGQSILSIHFNFLFWIQNKQNKMKLQIVHSFNFSSFFEMQKQFIAFILCNCLAIAHGNGSVVSFNTSLFSGVRERWFAFFFFFSGQVKSNSKQHSKWKFPGSEKYIYKWWANNNCMNTSLFLLSLDQINIMYTLWNWYSQCFFQWQWLTTIQNRSRLCEPLNTYDHQSEKQWTIS